MLKYFLAAVPILSIPFISLADAGGGGPTPMHTPNPPSPPAPAAVYDPIGQTQWPPGNGLGVLVGMVSKDGKLFKLCQGDTSGVLTCGPAAFISSAGDGIAWRAVDQIGVSNQLRIIVGMVSQSGDQFKVCMADSLSSAPNCTAAKGI